MKVFIFIDVANVWSTQKSVRKLLDYSNLKSTVKNCLQERLKQDVNIGDVFYYEAYPDSSTREYNTDGTHKFMTYLKKGLKFHVRKKPIKQIKTQDHGKELIVEKGNMDVEITIDSLHHKEKYDIAVFFTGDSDFFPLMKYLSNGGKKCYVFSSDNNVSQELRVGTCGYFNIAQIDEFWGDDLKYRNNKK